MELREILEELFKRMVEHPDELRVNQVGRNHTVIFEVDCHKRDIGILLGRKGIHAQSVRKLLKACGGRDRKYYDLELPEKELRRDGSPRPPRQRGGGRQRR